MFTFRDLLDTYLEPQVAARLAMAVPTPQVPTPKPNKMSKAPESEGLMPGEPAALCVCGGD